MVRRRLMYKSELKENVPCLSVSGWLVRAAASKWCTGVPKFLIVFYMVLCVVLQRSLLALDWPSLVAEWNVSDLG